MKGNDLKIDIKILLVDDREDNLMSMETILVPEGYHITKAHSGRDALKILLKENDFTLILMDVKMPGMDGLETASMIYEREKLRHIPIIFITAHNYGEEGIFQGYKTGGVDYLYKPINPELLKTKVSVFSELFRKTHLLLTHERKLVMINQNLEKEIAVRKSSEEKVKMLNRKLLENIQRLELMNAELDRFAYVASHDLQEPLRKIRAFGDRLLEKYRDVLGDDGKDYIDRMQKASARMQLLIDNILAFSKIANSGQSFEETNMEGLIREVLADIDLKNADITLDNLPKDLKVMPNLMRQLFQNLIVNAIKFRKKEEPPHIRIMAEIVDDKDANIPTIPIKARQYCKISVQDNGIGFEQKYAEQIFTMFQRLHGNTVYEGTGIGLSICKKIVEKHNGYIQAESNPGKGALFTVYLPYSVAYENSNYSYSRG